MWQPLNGEPALPDWGIIPQPDEPAHRFFARLTALNGQGSARSMAHQMGLNGRSGAGLLEFCLALPIREKERLQASTASIVGPQITLCGETFSKKDWSIHTARVCPACLSESPHARNWWDLKVVFRCPFHDELLIRESKEGSVTRWWTPSAARFVDGTSARKTRPVGETPMVTDSWEAYLLGRMSIGPMFSVALLHDMASMVEVVQAVEHVGRASMGGYSDKRPSIQLRGNARETIIRTGFAALSEGYPALRRIAASVADASPVKRSDVERWGIRGLFGWLTRAYNSALPDVPEFERALRDEAESRLIFQHSRNRPTSVAEDLPLTLKDLASELSLPMKVALALACNLGFAVPSKNRNRRYVFTKDTVEELKAARARLLDRTEAASFLGVDRHYLGALVNDGLLAASCRFKSHGVLSDRFDPIRLADVERELCGKFGRDWRKDYVPAQLRAAQELRNGKRRAEKSGNARFRKLSAAEGLSFFDAAALLRVDSATTKRLVDAGVLTTLKKRPFQRPRVTVESVARARARYAPAGLYADCLSDRENCRPPREALAALGVPALKLGRGGMAIVERAAARKALNLSCDPDQQNDSLSLFWRDVEAAIRMAGLPFRSTQAIPGTTLRLWDSSRWVRLAFAIVEKDGVIVASVQSSARAGRRSAMIPQIASRLRSDKERSGYELSDDGVVAKLDTFNVHDEGCWPVALRFITDYLAGVRHGIYDARVAQRKAIAGLQ